MHRTNTMKIVKNSIKTVKMLPLLIGVAVVTGIRHTIVRPRVESRKVIQKISLFGLIIVALIAFLRWFRSLNTGQKVALISCVLLGLACIFPGLFFIKTAALYCFQCIIDLFQDSILLFKQIFHI
jgi:hypothetical protein